MRRRPRRAVDRRARRQRTGPLPRVRYDGRLLPVRADGDRPRDGDGKRHRVRLGECDALGKQEDSRPRHCERRDAHARRRRHAYGRRRGGAHGGGHRQRDVGDDLHADHRTERRARLRRVRRVHLVVGPLDTDGERRASGRASGYAGSGFGRCHARRRTRGRRPQLPALRLRRPGLQLLPLDGRYGDRQRVSPRKRLEKCHGEDEPLRGLRRAVRGRRRDGRRRRVHCRLSRGAPGR